MKSNFQKIFRFGVLLEKKNDTEVNIMQVIVLCRSFLKTEV